MRKLILTTAFFCTTVCFAHDFSVKDKDNTLYYNITDSLKKEVELTYKGSVDEEHKSYEGELIISPTVTHNGKTYNVTAIGSKAFCGNDKLTGVEFPIGIRLIGDFAFEGCNSLTRVILPANEAKIGTGAFFRCENISKLSIGSDWQSINLKDYCWSKELKKITIPARIARIQNLVALPYLEEVTVDNNNGKFSSYDGALYNTDKSILLGCPRGRCGKLTIAKETETIRWGAVSRCIGLKEIVLQENMKYVSFREFAHLRNLETLQLRMAQPIMNATYMNQNVMAFQTANSKLVLVTPKAAKKAYTDAISEVSGRYAEIKANKTLSIPESMTDIEYDVANTSLASKAKIRCIKSFENH